MHNFFAELQQLVFLTKQNIQFLLIALLALWAFNVVNWLTGYRLNFLGIYPRRLHGLPGIVFAPFLHGSFGHLIFNSIPLFVLANFVLLGGLITFYCVSIIVIVISGTALWLFGRRAFHVGASGLIMGYWSYLLVQAYAHPTALTVILAIVSVYYFGGLLLALFPGEVQVSWEGHVFGFFAGVAATFLCPLVHNYWLAHQVVGFSY